MNAKFSVAEISEEKYDLTVDFKPTKFMVKPAENKKASKTTKKEKKKTIDEEW